MEDLLPELRDFIVNFLMKHKIKNVDLSYLNLETSLDLDLGLFDLDVDLFITDFVRAFNIDYSNFTWNNYGYPKDTFAISILRSFFDFKSNWVKRLANSMYQPKIKVFALQKAIKTGVLM